MNASMGGDSIWKKGKVIMSTIWIDREKFVSFEDQRDFVSRIEIDQLRLVLRSMIDYVSKIGKPGGPSRQSLIQPPNVHSKVAWRLN